MVWISIVWFIAYQQQKNLTTISENIKNKPENPLIKMQLKIYTATQTQLTDVWIFFSIFLFQIVWAKNVGKRQ